MKACKHCDILDHRRKLSDDDSESKCCNHTTESRSANLASFGLTPAHLRDVLLTAHLFGGYYQPAGPLISSHLLSSPQTQTTKTVPQGLDSDSLQSLQQPPQSTSTAESSDSEILVTGGDLTPRPQTFRYGPQPPGPYSRPIHPMHCPTYPPAYYSPYGQHHQDMCYSPPYQPYFPQKVYPSTPPYRRYVTGSYYQGPPPEMYDPSSSSAPPPPTGSQLVPAGPSGPPHMEHYPGPPYYSSGYPPPGAPCYSRGMQPFMEAPQYPSSSFCPMQSCSKNVNTGSLIGSNSSKGPGASNHSIDNTINSTLPTNKLQCKKEDVTTNNITKLIGSTSTEVKPETISHQFHAMATPSDGHKDQYEKCALTPLPTFSINSKIMEPDVSISPARGSIGLSVSPSQENSGARIITIGEKMPQLRKARLGKSMARERQMMMMSTPAAHIFHHHHHHHTSDGNESLNGICLKTDSIPAQIKNEVEKIKTEIVKEEKIDDEIIILDRSDDDEVSRVEPEPVQIIDDESFEGSSNKRKPETIDLDSSPEIPSATVKRRKTLLKMKNGTGKSPLKSYKKFIKRTDPKPYLCTPPGKLNTISYKRKMNARRRRRALMGGKTVLRLKTKLVLVSKKNRRNRKFRDRLLENKSEPQKTVTTGLKSTVEETIDLVARGYFSEPEVLTVKSKQVKKLKLAEGRSKSETNQKKDKSSEKIVFAETSSGSNSTPSTSTGLTETPKKPNNKKVKKSKESETESTEKQPEVIKEVSLNNNNSLVENHNTTLILPPTPPVRAASLKRNRSRTRKFSSKKKHKAKHVEQIEEILPVRQSAAAPRWSNGWTWEGQPFQSKIFMNSDDPVLLRTCYPAMRHVEGDIIRPRDCVLLRAGNKKGELPFVAKVAHLWENPEDGEMMMSLLWYYRPEHTEQGRQPIDAADEVFASRHKDHNSVACIEDKCYVLTYSEYCRYRRSLKALEEGIEEIPEVVPKIQKSESPRIVPPNTAIELVMFCGRIYDFRKKLTKTPP